MKMEILYSQNKRAYIPESKVKIQDQFKHDGKMQPFIYHWIWTRLFDPLFQQNSYWYYRMVVWGCFSPLGVLSPSTTHTYI